MVKRWLIVATLVVATLYAIKIKPTSFHETISMPKKCSGVSVVGHVNCQLYATLSLLRVDKNFMLADEIAFPNHSMWTHY